MLSAMVYEHRGGVFEMFCDQHSMEADPDTGFAPPVVVTDDRAYAQRRVDSHNAKFHPVLEAEDN